MSETDKQEKKHAKHDEHGHAKHDDHGHKGHKHHKHNKHHGHSGGGSSGDMLYALGIFGAAVYYWQGAETNQEKGIAVLKGLLWPSFMVYEAFTILGDARK